MSDNYKGEQSRNVSEIKSVYKLGAPNSITGAEQILFLCGRISATLLRYRLSPYRDYFAAH